VRRRGAPVSVSFSGLDGAGKTRQITELRDHLAATGLSVDVVWVPFKIWPEGLLNRLPAGWRSRLGPGRRSSPGDASQGGPAKAPATNGLVRSARRWAWTVVGGCASVSAGLSLRRRRSGSAADVLVLDRYRLDSIVKLQFWYAEVPAGLLAGLVRRLAPAPDVEILLRVGAEVAYARKPEQWTPGQLARQACSYDALAAAGGVVVLDGTADPEILAREVAHRVDAAFRER
jgi:thymidylate kinase